MAATKSLSIRIDADLKKESESILSKLGLSTSTAVSMLLKTIVRNRAVPSELFSIGADNSKSGPSTKHLTMSEMDVPEYEEGLVPNEETIAAIEEGRRLAHDPHAERYHDVASLRKALGV